MTKKIKTPSQRTKGAGLVAFGTGLLITVLILVFNKMGPTPLSKLLPLDQTIAYLELNIGDSQARDASDLLNKYEPYTSENLKESLSEIIGINFKDTDFLGTKMGISFIKSKSNQANIAVFVHITDRSKALKFLESLALKDKGDEFLCGDLNGNKICNYTFSYNVHLTFLKEYMVITPSQHREILLTILENDKSLSGSQKFIQVRNNLPTRNVAFAYIDGETLLNSLFENKNFVEAKGYELSALAPFLSIFKSHGTALLVKDKHLAIRTYTNIDKEKIQDKRFITFDKKYKANLARYADKKPLMFFGGRNVTKQLKRLARILSGEKPGEELLLEGVLRAQIEKYLGSDVSLEEDIYPILNGEYALLMEGEKESPKYKFLLELSDSAIEKEKIKELLAKFVEINAVFAPKVVEIELEDGTKAKEIIASKEEVVETHDTYKSTDITSLALGKKDWGIHYAFLDNVVIFGSSKESVQTSIDLAKNPAQSFQKSYPFEALVKDVMQSGDEISFINIDVLINKLGLQGGYTKYLTPFSTAISSKNFFDDGIATTHYILLK